MLNIVGNSPANMLVAAGCGWLVDAGVARVRTLTLLWSITLPVINCRCRFRLLHVACQLQLREVCTNQPAVFFY
jgi:hypothetical protein